MAGRCIAYFGPDDCEVEVQKKLIAIGFEKVSLRMGLLWGGEVENWATHIWAPGYPGIVRAYADAVRAREVADMEEAGQRTRPPERILALPHAHVITIVSAGPHAKEALDKYGIDGISLAVNDANKIMPTGPDWHLANDGFVNHPDAVHGIRICRLVHAHTVPSGPWFALDDAVEVGSDLSSLAAIRLAIACKPRRLRILGHDCCPGKAVAPKDHGWDDQRLASLREQTSGLLEQANAAGITTAWCSKVGGRWQEIRGKAGRP